MLRPDDGYRAPRGWSPMFILALALLALGTSCGGTDTPPDRHMDVGFLRGTDFTLLRPNDVLWVREGVQTGRWIMPTVRIWGVSGVAVVRTEVELDDGRRAGGFTANLPFVQVDEGTRAMRFDFMAIPIGGTAEVPEPDEVWGHGAQLRFEVDDRRGAPPVRSATNVRLEDGDAPGAGSNGDFPAAPPGR